MTLCFLYVPLTSAVVSYATAFAVSLAIKEAAKTGIHGCTSGINTLTSLTSLAGGSSWVNPQRLSRTDAAVEGIVTANVSGAARSHHDHPPSDAGRGEMQQPVLLRRGDLDHRKLAAAGADDDRDGGFVHWLRVPCGRTIIPSQALC
jgi:hypothetical protein